MRDRRNLRTVFGPGLAMLSVAAFLAAAALPATHLKAADPPSAEQALGLKPIQQHVDYAQPAGEEIARCTVRAQQTGGETAWVVTGGNGEVLRRFADTNGDNVVDQWSYFKDGLEVYRDIDANFNRKPDQYRWLHTGGTKWGLDENEDGKIDQWKTISAEEVVEEVVLALKARDTARFELLLIPNDELEALGLGEARQKQVAAAVDAAPSEFQKLAGTQRVVTARSNFVDFGSTRPAMIPAGTNGSTRDMIVYDNVTALVETAGKNDWVYVGTIVSTGGKWRLLDAPSLDATAATTMFASATTSTPAAGALEAPSEEMQELLAQFDRLDRQAEQMPLAQQGDLTERRADLLERLAEISPTPELRADWIRQLADMVSTTVQGGGYDQGVSRLEALATKLGENERDRDLVAHVKFRRLWAVYGRDQLKPNADAAKNQATLMEGLAKFVEEYQESPHAAEALLNLGMSHEFSGDAEKARESYRELTRRFPDSEPAAKATGALRRLDSEGKSISLRGPSLRQGNVSLGDYRGKVVVVQYWATWCDPCKEDMEQLKQLRTRYGARGFEVLGVCLDDNPAAAQAYIREERIPWRHLHEPGGLDGRLANEMGVMTLPLMMLVNKQGQVESNSIHAAEVEAELRRLLQ